MRTNSLYFRLYFGYFLSVYPWVSECVLAANKHIKMACSSVRRTHWSLANRRENHLIYNTNTTARWQESGWKMLGKMLRKMLGKMLGKMRIQRGAQMETRKGTGAQTTRDTSPGLTIWTEFSFNRLQALAKRHRKGKSRCTSRDSQCELRGKLDPKGEGKLGKSPVHEAGQKEGHIKGGKG